MDVLSAKAGLPGSHMLNIKKDTTTQTTDMEKTNKKKKRLINLNKNKQGNKIILSPI